MLVEITLRYFFSVDGLMELPYFRSVGDLVCTKNIEFSKEFDRIFDLVYPRRLNFKFPVEKIPTGGSGWREVITDKFILCINGTDKPAHGTRVKEENGLRNSTDVEGVEKVVNCSPIQRVSSPAEFEVFVDKIVYGGFKR